MPPTKPLSTPMCCNVYWFKYVSWWSKTKCWFLVSTRVKCPNIGQISTEVFRIQTLQFELVVPTIALTIFQINKSNVALAPNSSQQDKAQGIWYFLCSRNGVEQTSQGTLLQHFISYFLGKHVIRNKFTTQQIYLLSIGELSN